MMSDERPSPALRLLHGVQAMYAEIGAILAPPGTTLYCAQCGHEEPLTAEAAARYTAEGWPKHCGRTMLRARMADRPDLAALLEQLQPLDERALARWAANALDEDDDELGDDYVPTLTLMEVMDGWRCGWTVQPDEATEWTIYAEGRTPLAAAQALLDKMRETTDGD
jgi:hypothetical protein